MKQAVLLDEVRSKLEGSKHLSGQCLQAVCDMLLSCAITHRNTHDIVNNHTFAVMVRASPFYEFEDKIK